MRSGGTWVPFRADMVVYCAYRYWLSNVMSGAFNAVTTRIAAAAVWTGGRCCLFKVKTKTSNILVW